MPEADYNVAPTTFQPVIRASKETGERELVAMRWGPISGIEQLPVSLGDDFHCAIGHCYCGLIVNRVARHP